MADTAVDFPLDPALVNQVFQVVAMIVLTIDDLKKATQPQVGSLTDSLAQLAEKMQPESDEPWKDDDPVRDLLDFAKGHLAKGLSFGVSSGRHPLEIALDECRQRLLAELVNLPGVELRLGHFCLKTHAPEIAPSSSADPLEGIDHQ